MDAGDVGRLEIVTNSVEALERRLPYTVECSCGETVTAKSMQPVYCKCGTLHRFRTM
jgi:hypothetical protein